MAQVFCIFNDAAIMNRRAKTHVCARRRGAARVVQVVDVKLAHGAAAHGWGHHAAVKLAHEQQRHVRASSDASGRAHVPLQCVRVQPARKCPPPNFFFLSYSKFEGKNGNLEYTDRKTETI